MKLLALTDAELDVMKRALELLWEHQGVYELLASIGGRALRTRCPPTLIHHIHEQPYARGPRRRISGRLFHEKGMDVMLLECGHVVSRHTRHAVYTYCEACLACQDLDYAAG